MTDSDDIIYRVNDLDEIIFVNEAWDRFSEANDSVNADSAKVLHHSLWQFITDSTTRELYKQILSRIRAGRSLQFSLRCDSPMCRRLLEMHVYPTKSGAVEFRTHILSEEFRNAPVLLESRSPRSQQMLRVCGWCNKVFVNETWVEIEEAVARFRLFEHGLLPSITHGICGHCHQSMTDMIGERSAATQDSVSELE